MSFVSKTLATLTLAATAFLLRAGPLDPQNDPPTEIEGVPGVAAARAVVNFSDLAARADAQSPAKRKDVPLTRRGPLRTAWAPANTSFSPMPAPELASPSSATDFLALPDSDGLPGGVSIVPPDTHGAVGPNHVMTTLNSQVRIQNRSGSVISTVLIDNFWAGVGGNPNCFDPKILYDQFNNRWMFTACADLRLSTSALLIGVTQTSDPTGTWFLYKVDADASNVNWADYPSLGFNKNWIVVSVNLYSIGADNYGGVDIYAFNKTNLFANGSGSFTKVHVSTGNTLVPAITCDNTNTTEYLIDDWIGGAGQLRMSRITGTPTTATLTLGTSFPVSGSWGGGGGADLLPQLGTTMKIAGGDSSIQNVVQRNGKLWTTHTVFLGSGTRAAVQWWQLTTNGTVTQVARIDDPSGNNHFAYPTLAVNANNDMLIGYSRFGATQYVSANYAFRFSTDALNTLRTDTVLKAGEGPYIKTFGGPNRWGDYSSTVVDPVNDVSMWTIQEYAATPVNPATADGNGRWGTWWGRFDSGVESAALVSAALSGESCSPTNGAIDPGESVAITFTVRNSGGIDISNLVATLLAGSGVSGPSAPQSYGAMPVGGTNVFRSLTFVATGACGGIVTTRLQLQDGPVDLGTFTNTFALGAPKVAFAENFDSVSPPALPAGWTNFKSGAESLWITTNIFSDTPPNSIFVPDPPNVGDAHITSPAIAITTTNARLTFRHRYDFENTYDGGVLEIAIGAGAFADVITSGGAFIANGYTAALSSEPMFQSPLIGRMAWTGYQTNFITSTVRLPAAAAGQSVRLRWRAGTDTSTSGGSPQPGWFVDSVSLLDGTTCCSGLMPPTIVNVRNVGNNVAFSFASAPGHTYNVEYKGSLTVSNWLPLQTILGDGSVKDVTNFLTTTNRFFRLNSP